ncbi:NADP-dependent oxidoreductase domain-containing protein [Cladorrhinum sp. PSN259]|nr:NADP-dependent oxidoreductase domain-containing protein [Cladorrhinum sp. PSN259]
MSAPATATGNHPLLPSAPPPKTLLGRYRLLAPTASVWVSPLCLGAMNFGDAWEKILGACSQETTEQILDHFFESGGNFIDTASNYQYEESETRVGAWMKKRNNRDQIVLATKYSTNYQTRPQAPAGGSHKIYANYGGNGTKSLHVSVEASLKKLQTDYIDILYIHWYDMTTSIPELMTSLNRLVSAGKVLYLGVSDTPAWVVSKANEFARCHGLRPFSVYQGRWSASFRDFERDIIPMCKAEGMGIAPWGALGSGRFRTEAQRAEAKKEGRQAEPSEAEVKVSQALEKVAARKKTLITSVALAYVSAKAPYVFPIVGCRTVEHLKGNIAALEVKLSDEDIKEIEGAVPFDLGFPMGFLYGKSEVPESAGDMFTMQMNGVLDHVKEVRAFNRE